MMSSLHETSTAASLHTPRGTPFSKMLACCFPPKSVPHKNKSRSVDFAGAQKPTLEYEDPDKSESGMVYFDLPDDDVHEDEDEQVDSVQAPPLVKEFWKFIFSLFLFEWLRNNKNQPKRIKNE